ncbi:MAG: hypothetical protein H0V70_08890 [Ktedonobacteraceae bacterium]|nr:hypothetical protein [Ktedonobacteraceae bacterium]
MAMTPSQMLKELASMNHKTRIGRVIELGHQAGAGTNVAVIIAAWEQGDFYERWLALYTCYGSRDSEHVLRALSDSSSIIRGLACKLSVLLCDDVQLQKALALVPAKQQTVIVRELYKRQRFTPIDTFLQTLAAQGANTSLFKLLGFGSAHVVTQYIEQVLPYANSNDLRRLARLHPELLLASLQVQAEAVIDLDPDLTWRTNTVLPILAKTHPDTMLALVTALVRYTPLTNLQLQPLVAKRPNEMAALLFSVSDKVRLDFSHSIQRLNLDHIMQLIERQDMTLSNRDIWFRHVQPEQRGVIYTKYGKGWYDTEGCLSEPIVAALPRELRYQEARRHIGLPALATRPFQRLLYAAYLPWDEALTILNLFIKNPDPELRALALKTLMGAIRFHRDKLSEALTLVHARRNEQDPVRYAMLLGLANLPPSAWLPNHLDALAQIMSEALDAADLSSLTSHAIGKLIFLLLPTYPDWGAKQLVLLATKHGSLRRSNIRGNTIEERLSDADMQRLAPILLPVLHEWRDRERQEEIFAVASALGKRLRVFDGFFAILQDAVNTWRSHAEIALEYIANSRYELLHTLIPQLIERDRSWGTRRRVYTYLHRHRQDLITPFLGQEAFSGWFSTGRTRFVLPLTTGFHRWTPEQQRIFATALTSVTRDEKRDNQALFYVIHQLSALPAISPNRLIELAHDERLALRDTALRALGRLDDASQGIPTLLDSLNDDRARIAIYVLRRAILTMPVEKAFTLLNAVPLQRVTVAKEVIRLLGDLASEEAYRMLLTMYGREDLHRDVRIALLRALWTYLEKDETWNVMESAAQSPDIAIAKSVTRIPSDRLSLQAQQHLLAVLALLLSHPEPEVRQATLERCILLPINDAEKVLFPKILTALTSRFPDERNIAAQALFATYTGKHALAVSQVVTTLLPRRQAVQNVVFHLQRVLLTNKRLHMPTAYAVLDVLEQDALATRFSLGIAITALPVEELANYFIRLSVNGRLHAGMLIYACTMLENPQGRTDLTDFIHLEKAFRSSSDERLRRLAFAALVGLARTAQGWTEECLALQRQYRSDSSLLVADAALATRSPLDNEE